jgi:hypothetical protein
MYWLANHIGLFFAVLFMVIGCYLLVYIWYHREEEVTIKDIKEK